MKAYDKKGQAGGETTCCKKQKPFLYLLRTASEAAVLTVSPVATMDQRLFSIFCGRLNYIPFAWP